MATNIELKARYADLDRAESLARGLGAELQPVLNQVDTYFNVKDGRLKLREINGEHAELIHYRRANHAEIRKSDYSILDLSPQQAKTLVAQLTASIGVLTVVAKRRQLLMWKDVRIHLDRVENLGNFLEFEGLVGPTCSEAAAAAKVETLTREMAVAEGDRISTSYSDLLLGR